MPFFITTNASGAIMGLYNDALLAPPAGAVQISDADGKTLASGSPPMSEYLYQNGVLAHVGISLADARTAQVSLLDKACSSAIVSGFASGALGAAHTYPSQPNDQSNLIGAVTASQSPGIGPTWTVPFWCMDSTGTWVFAVHTPAQIQQVLQDGVVQRVAYSNKLASLKTQVAAATTVAAVQAIVW